MKAIPSSEQEEIKLGHSKSSHWDYSLELGQMRHLQPFPPEKANQQIYSLNMQDEFLSLSVQRLPQTAAALDT